MRPKRGGVDPICAATARSPNFEMLFGTEFRSSGSQGVCLSPTLILPGCCRNMTSFHWRVVPTAEVGLQQTLPEMGKISCDDVGLAITLDRRTHQPPPCSLFHGPESERVDDCAQED